jgi:hypothetical protein
LLRSKPVTTEGDAMRMLGLAATSGSRNDVRKAAQVLLEKPYFESGFPYEHDQWISSMATGWATKALAVGMPVPTTAAK